MPQSFGQANCLPSASWPSRLSYLSLLAKQTALLQPLGVACQTNHHWLQSLLSLPSLPPYWTSFSVRQHLLPPPKIPLPHHHLAAGHHSTHYCGTLLGMCVYHLTATDNIHLFKLGGGLMQWHMCSNTWLHSNIIVWRSALLCTVADTKQRILERAPVACWHPQSILGLTELVPCLTHSSASINWLTSHSSHSTQDTPALHPGHSSTPPWPLQPLIQATPALPPKPLQLLIQATPALPPMVSVAMFTPEAMTTSGGSDTVLCYDISDCCQHNSRSIKSPLQLNH
ncbi:hypothetical protein E2C01_093379 [Portunus trituberculatus]|uniref:Uncharacterized protein n=1 Tax=Portunus trituberculatus TaxID=210409 RepID=A0A5B7JTD5_PORTR|nr:hypothetical protein [Portunus trituberculatus]